MSREIDLPWLAGFFEGEGSICISRLKHGWWGVVTLNQQNEECIRRVLDLCKELKLPEPCISLPRKSSLGFQLNWYALKGAAVLQVIRIYFRHPYKIARADIYLEFWDEAKRGEERVEEKWILFERWNLQRQQEKLEKEELREQYCKEELN